MGFESVEEGALGPGSRLDIEEYQREAGEAVSSGGDGGGGESDPGRVVGQGAAGEFTLVEVEEGGEVGSGRAAGAERVEGRLVETEFFEGIGEGSGEAGEGGDGLEVVETALAEGLGGDARREGFADDVTDREELAGV